MQTSCSTFFILCFIGLLIQPVYAQNDSNELTVEESVRMGLEHSYSLQIARADKEESEAAHSQAQARRLPSIRSQASYMRLSNNIPEVDFQIPGTDSTVTVLPVEVNQFHSEVSIEQPLFTGGRLNRQIEAADHRANAAGLMEKQEQAQVAFEIRQAYWNLYRAQSSLETLDAALNQVEEHLRDVQTRVDEGAALRSDLLSVRTRRSEVLLDQVEARSRIRVARLELNRLIGLPAETEIEPVAPDETATIPYEMEDLTEQAMEQRPDLNALSEQVKANEAEMSSVKSGWLPELNLVGRYVYARPNQYFFAEQDQFRGSWEAGVSLRWDIWSGGQRIHETSRARAQLQRAEASLANRRDQVHLEATRQYLELERSMEAIEAAAENVEAAEEAYRSIRVQFDEGAALSTQLMDAEYDLRMAQARHTEAVSDYQIANAAILNALGQVWGGGNDL